jgi:hypothetical protein
MARNLDELGDLGDLGDLARLFAAEVRYPTTASEQSALMERNPGHHRVLVAALTEWQQEVHGI